MADYNNDSENARAEIRRRDSLRTLKTRAIAANEFPEYKVAPSMWPFKSPSSAATDSSLSVAEAASTPVNAPTPPTLPVLASTMTAAQRVNEKLERQEWLGYSNERLGVIFPLRAILLMGVSFLSGASLGAAKGSSIAADRYRAENAHRLPTTRNGWFLYHKSKNYHAIHGGMKEGAKFGTLLTGWAFLFMVTEEVVDQSRARVFASKDEEYAMGQRDAASTVISAMTIAGIYNWRQGFDRYNAARTARMALKYSLIYGLAQDILATLRGDRPAYVRWIARRTFWPSADTEET